MRVAAGRQRQRHGQRPERAERERHAPAERQREHRKREAAHEDGGGNARLLDAKAEALPVGRYLLRHEQVDGRLRDRVREPRDRKQEEQGRE
jgi:hypothetical protein